MRLRRFQIQNYRSIVDSGVVEVEDRTTVLIGKNEQGKTTALRALASLSARSGYGPGDLPTHLRAAFEDKKPADIPIATVWLAPEDVDKEALQAVVPNVEEVREFRATRFNDGHIAYARIDQEGREEPLAFSPPNLEPQVAALKQHAGNLRQALAGHGTRAATFAPQLPQATGHIDQFLAANFQAVEQIDNLVKTFATVLTSVPGQDGPIQTDIANTVKAMQAAQAEIAVALQNDVAKQFKSRLPNFVFHSTTLDKVPNEVNVSAFIKNPEAVSKGMANRKRSALAPSVSWPES
jgi:hypothetical protein